MMSPRDDQWNWWIETSRLWIIKAYSSDYNAHQGASLDNLAVDFGELLCWELHSNDTDFKSLAAKWNVSLLILAELVADHIRRLE